MDRIPKIKDYQLERKIRSINTLIDRYGFVVTKQSHELSEVPMLSNTDVGIVRGSYGERVSGEYIDGKTSWGSFNQDYQANCYYLVDGDIPEKYEFPSPKLIPGTARIYDDYIVLVTTDEEIELDIEVPPDEISNYSFFKYIAKKLYNAGIRIAIYEFEDHTDRSDAIWLSNDSAMIDVSSAIWDTNNQQLVAVYVFGTSVQLTDAIAATLATNRETWIRLKVGKKGTSLRGARRGFKKLTCNFSKAGATGHSQVLLNPLVGDPQLSEKEEYCYIVGAPGDPPAKDLIENRLNLGQTWPVKQEDPEWNEYLFSKGTELGLIKELPMAGNDFAYGYLVRTNSVSWEKVLCDALKGGHIKIG